MLWMCETLYGTSKSVLMDSVSCVSKGIVELEQKGVYGASLIKKRNYWPKVVHGAAINAYYEDNDVNNCGML